MTRTRRTDGFTLIEVMVAIAILTVMMMIAWGTVSQTTRANQHFTAAQERSRQARVALSRIAADVEMAYLSHNEDRTLTDTRTFFIGEQTGDVTSLRFSTFAHIRMYADANESDQTIVAYFAAPDAVNRSKTNVMRREARRPILEKWDMMPGETEILFPDVKKLRFQYWDFRAQDWKDTWTTQGVEGAANKMPSRVRISLTFIDENNKETTITTQARINLTEALQFYAN